MIWTSLDFGKHAGLTLPEALFKDPDWFFWMMKQPNPFQNNRSLRDQADDLLRKATRIRIPGNGEEEELEIEHMVHFPSQLYGGFLVLPASKQSHQGSSQTLRRDHLDMSVPRQIATYDKAGGKLLIRCMKPIYFGSKSVRLTKQRCEAFFNDESNFNLD